jgi:hypothetical protein
VVGGVAGADGDWPLRLTQVEVPTQRRACPRYEIVYRETTEPLWTNTIKVGNVTTYTKA